MKAFLQVSGGILKYSLPLFPWFLVFQGLHLSLPVDFYVVALLSFFIWMVSGNTVEMLASHYRGWGHKKQLDEYIKSYIDPLYVMKDTDPLRSHLERLHEIGVNEITIKTKEDVSLFPSRLVREALVLLAVTGLTIAVLQSLISLTSFYADPIVIFVQKVCVVILLTFFVKFSYYWVRFGRAKEWHYDNQSLIAHLRWRGIPEEEDEWVLEFGAKMRWLSPQKK